MKKMMSLALCFLLIFAFAGCAEKTDNQEDQSEFEYLTDNPVATIKVKDFGTITVELYYDKAPNTVKNFISLANCGFYDGLIFHRVIENFMIQGGDPDGNGTGGPGYSIAGEFSLNGVNNDISHVRGVISMARSKAYDSAGSQFFICHADSAYLDGQYAAFGMVLEGMDVVDEIAAVKTNSNDKPYDDVVIESVTVNTNGLYYDEPLTLVN